MDDGLSPPPRTSLDDFDDALRVGALPLGGTSLPRPTRLFDPGVVDRLAIGAVVGPEGEELKAVGARLEGAHDLGSHADGVERPDVSELLVELDLPTATQDHVDLLSVPVAMREGTALARPKAEVSHSRVPRFERRSGYASFPTVAEPV
jgi:hypothetical protein